MIFLALVAAACAGKAPAGRRMADGPPLIVYAEPLMLPQDLTGPPPSKNVVLEVEVDASGKPISVKVTKSCGVEAVDQRCVETANRYKFRPAYSGGKAVAGKTRVTFSVAGAGRSGQNIPPAIPFMKSVARTDNN